jgi:hypothetical protein
MDLSAAADRSTMNSRTGQFLGLVGGAVAVAGFFSPWLDVTTDVRHLREVLGASAGPVEEMLAQRASMIPPIWSLGNPVLFTNTAWPRVAAPLLLAFAVLTTVSSGPDLFRKMEPRTRGRLRSGTAWFGAAVAALSLSLPALAPGAPAPIASVLPQGLIELAEDLGLDSGVIEQAVGPLDQVHRLSFGPGFYLCFAGGLLGVAGGIIAKRRKTTE